MSDEVKNPTPAPPKDEPPDRASETIIYAAGERPLLLLRDGDIFTGAGLHVARLNGQVAYDPSGRYVGTLVDNRLVFQDEDCLTFGPLFVRAIHPGFEEGGTDPRRTLEREVSIHD